MKILEMLTHAQKAYGYLQLLREGEYAMFALEAFGDAPLPSYRPDISVVGPQVNALGLDACGSALVLFNTLEAFVVGIQKDDGVKGDKRAFNAAAILLRHYLRRYVSANFDKSSIESAGKQIGLPDLSRRFKSLVPSVSRPDLAEADALSASVGGKRKSAPEDKVTEADGANSGASGSNAN